MRLRAEAIERGVNLFVQDLSVETVKEVAKRTPVDTGLARSNWILTAGSPSQSTKDIPYNPYPKYSQARGQGINEVANLNNVIDTARFTAKTRKPGSTIFIVNNLPYIKRLNNGYSGQAPMNFVRLGVLSAVNIMRGKKLQISIKT